MSTETDAKKKVCPINTISLALLASSIMQADPTLRSTSEEDQMKLKETKNCTASRCMMWDRKRRDCGLKGRN